MRRKILSLTLTFMLIVTMLPVAVQAVDPGVTVTISGHTAGSLGAEIAAYMSANRIANFSDITGLTVSGGTFNAVDRAFLYSTDSESHSLHLTLKDVDLSGTSIDFTGISDYPASVPNELPPYAFGNWTALTSIRLPDSLTKIYDWVFSNCASLESVYLPVGLTYIDYDAFHNSSLLKDIYTTSATPPDYVSPYAFEGVATGAVLHVSTGSGAAYRAVDDGNTADNLWYGLTIAEPAPTVGHVTVTPAATTVKAGSTLSLSATVTGTGAPTQAVTWSVSGNHSSDTRISNAGVLTIAPDETAAMLTIRAASTADASKSGTASVHVIPSAISDFSSGVTLDLSGATLPDGVTSVTLGSDAVQSNSGSSAYTAVVGLIGSDTSIGNPKNLIVYDLKLLDQNGNPVENFTGKIKVKIPIPAGWSGDLHVYWYNPDNNTLTDMHAAMESGYLVFETTHFSYYALAQLPAKPSSDAIPNPKTGNGSAPTIPLALFGVGSAAGIIILKKSMKWKAKKKAL